VKKVLKNQTEPPLLITFRNLNPNGDWNQFKDANNGKAYSDCRDQILSDQFNLCAYCEYKIEISDALGTRIEHFHPKSDTTEISKNWALMWENLIGVCNGGDNPHLKNYESPLPKNLSCDSHKNHMESKGKVPKNCEGWILNPIFIIENPCIFKIDFDGILCANELICQSITIQENHFETVEKLVNNTILLLNLNCDRLAKQRVLTLRDIDHNMKKWRTNDKNVSQNLISFYLGYKWKPFFTTIRLRLGNIAEEYLKSINFQG
jgi:uncharacterized protein (TIGR02646 family)